MLQSLFIGGGELVILSPGAKKDLLESFKKRYKSPDGIVVEVRDIGEWRKKIKQVPPVLEDYNERALVIRVVKFAEQTRGYVVGALDEVSEYFNDSIQGRAFSTDALFVGRTRTGQPRRVGMQFLRS